MALKLGELVAYIRADDADFERGVDRSERRFDQFGNHIGDAVDQAAAAAAAAGERGGRNFGDGLWRSADGRLRDALGRFAAEGETLGRSLGQGIGRGAGSAISSLQNLTSSAWGVVPALLAVFGAVVVLGPAVYAFGGLLASIPALVSGAAAAIAVLGIGFHGLAGAFGKSAAGGASAAQRADQVARAQRGLAQAQRDAQEATEAVTRAREEEVERLEDLSRALARAHINERSAIRSVAQAERDLQKARAGGNPDQILEAEDRLEQAKLDLDEVRDRVDDLSKEQAKADRVGVEGSDQVKAALDRQRRALEQIIDAEAALRQSRQSGGGAAADVVKLAPAAAELVALIKSLKPEWEDLRLSVQQRLFAGVPQEVKELAKVWFPFLKIGLGNMADTLNGIFKIFSGSAKDPDFIRNIGVGLDAVDGLIDKVGRTVAGPFVDAWGRLSRASKPVVDLLGDKLAGGIESFARWIESADESGELEAFMERAAYYLGEIWDLGGNALGVLGDLVGLFLDSERGESAAGLFEDVGDALEDLNTWLDDEENRQKLNDFADGVATIGMVLLEVIGWLLTEGIPAIAHFVGDVSTGIDVVVGWFERLGETKDWLVGKLDELVGFAAGLPGRMSRATAGLWAGVKEDFKATINWVIGGWNRLQFSLGGGSFFGIDFPSTTIGTPDIPYLAAGGTALQAGMAIVGDRGPEAMYMPAGAQVQPLAPGWRNQQGGGPMRIVGELLVRGTGLLAGLREHVAVNGGEVQEVFGSGRSA